MTCCWPPPICTTEPSGLAKRASGAASMFWPKLVTASRTRTHFSVTPTERHFVSSSRPAVTAETKSRAFMNTVPNASCPTSSGESMNEKTANQPEPEDPTAVVLDHVARYRLTVIDAVLRLPQVATFQREDIERALATL